MASDKEWSDFRNAEKKCKDMGAHLASINNPEENDFVFSLAGKDDKK